MTGAPGTRLPEVAEIAAVPEGATPLAAAIVVSYLDDEGDECIGLSTHGDSTLSNLLGLLAWAQMSLYADHNGETP